MKLLITFTLSLTVHFLLKVEAFWLIGNFGNDGSLSSKEKHDGNLFFKGLSLRRVQRPQLEEKTQNYSLASLDMKRSQRFPLPYVHIKIQAPNSLMEESPFRIAVPLEPNMSVMKSLMSAARKFSRRNPDKQNPFAILLLWNTRDECYQIESALSIHNTQLQLWRLVIQNSFNQKVFNGLCVPERPILRPGSRVTLVYS